MFIEEPDVFEHETLRPGLSTILLRGGYPRSVLGGAAAAACQARSPVAFAHGLAAIFLASPPVRGIFAFGAAECEFVLLRRTRDIFGLVHFLCVRLLVSALLGGAATLGAAALTLFRSPPVVPLLLRRGGGFAGGTAVLFPLEWF